MMYMYYSSPTSSGQRRPPHVNTLIYTCILLLAATDVQRKLYQHMLLTTKIGTMAFGPRKDYRRLGYFLIFVGKGRRRKVLMKISRSTVCDFEASCTHRCSPEIVWGYCGELRMSFTKSDNDAATSQGKSVMLSHVQMYECE